MTFAANVTGQSLTTGELAINKDHHHRSRRRSTGDQRQSKPRINIAAGPGTVAISGLTIREGSTKSDGSDFFGGGGVLITNGIVNLSSCLITGNNSTSSGNPDGGGVDNEGGTVTISRCAITNNTVTNNVASNGAFYFGGGVFSEGPAMTIDNSTITGNTCGPFGNGGGLAFFTNVTLTNSTVYGNGANGGGNILRGGGTLTFKNNIIGGGILTGINGTGIDISGGGFSSQDYNLIQTTTGGTISGTTTHNVTGVSPGLMPLGNYGGPIPSMLPAPNSPAVNSGDPTLVGIDQRGLPRSVGGQSDIGAVETNYSLTATSGDLQFTVINTPFPTPLQAMVQESGNGISGVTVTFNAPGSSPSGTFPGPASSANVVSGKGGTATAPVFTADGTLGAYSVTITIGPGITTASYTLTNLGPTAANSAISGRIVDGQGTPVAGVTIKLNGGQTRRAITDALGNYRFADVETGALYTLMPSRPNYSFNPANRSFSQIGNHTEASFTAAAGAESANPLDTAEYFVRQQYLDFLGREPDEEGFAYWSDQITACAGDQGCVRTRRIDVSAAFFIAREFQQSGSFIFDAYTGALGRRPAFTEYAVDRQEVVGGATLDAAKIVFAQNFVQRSEFTTRYQANTTAASFVDALIENVRSSVDLTGERANLISAYSSGSNTVSSRAAVVRAIADNARFKQAQYNAAFVLTEYFSYLRRDPDQGGYTFWVNVLNNGTPGNYVGMVCSFVTSAEYQRRFGSLVSHSNAECGQ